MSARYQPVSWNRAKIFYDAALVIAVVAYILCYLKLGPILAENASKVDAPIQRIRAFGSCAFLMLSVVLCIGPAARLDRRFLPLLYNRRHFGVLTCAVALAHASFVLDWYFAFSPLDPYVAALQANTSYTQALGFPFEAFGMLALALLIVLAVTSHDFWLRFMTPPVWKAVHMSIYVAYALVVAHLTFGALQDPNKSLVSIALLLMPPAIVIALHVIAAAPAQVLGAAPADEPWLNIGPPDAIPNKCAKVVVLSDTSEVAIFRYDGKASAVTNACAHQNGPLGEGRIVGGCVTCPWHGFQYRPADGCAPPPYTEKLATYRLKLEGGHLWLDPRPNPPGTYVEPVQVPA